MRPVAMLAAAIFALLPLSEAAAQAKLSRVFTFDMLGAQIPYLEHLVGPAMHVNPGPQGTELRDYRVDGCRVQATIGSNNPAPPAVKALSLDLSPRCYFDFAAFRLSPLSTRGLTISKVPFWNSLGFESDCIYMCGNAADPAVDFIQQSSHASNWIGVVYSITIADNRTLGASEKLRTLIQTREGEDYVINTKFNCDQKYINPALQLFANMPVNRVTVGIFPGDPGGRCQ